ncbi:probable G-protein coupled receptor 141 [Esox lucius]|uniref:G-protein coupled receptors family 1 profile domain-containing protein n=1 Tax=Esox lucius TaxID=8010 RepID=A0AAY5L6E1_ESOLU|nr:probable G-protein coupled receptor 141 [Esox lucius]XP_010892376.1 probable G-protein coupled receptor 141 [Esox lucius]
MVNGSNTDVSHLPASYRHALLSLYTTVLIGGVLSMSLMIRMLKSNVCSVTATAALNLIAVHILFLLTVPFRIYYYAADSWDLGQKFCKVVSAMIHAHMYLTFVFYSIILVYRHLTSFRPRQVESIYRRLHPLWASAAVWGLVLTVVIPVMVFNYGSLDHSNATTDNQCLHFGNIFSNREITYAALNYTFSALIIIVTLALAVCQLWILGRVYRSHKGMIVGQQEFLAQIKSIYFMLVIIVCFVPYNTFRFYYVSNYNEDLEAKNEIALAFTTFCCFDMLILIGKESFRPCDSICCV